MDFSINNAIKKLQMPWSPINIATFNGQILRLALFEGKYREHTHEYDEFFLVYQGEIVIVTGNGTITLGQGEGVVIPKGILHKPIAKVPSYVLMIDADEKE